MYIGQSRNGSEAFSLLKLENYLRGHNSLLVQSLHNYVVVVQSSDSDGCESVQWWPDQLLDNWNITVISNITTCQHYHTTNYQQYSQTKAFTCLICSIIQNQRFLSGLHTSEDFSTGLITERDSLCPSCNGGVKLTRWLDEILVPVSDGHMTGVIQSNCPQVAIRT